MATTTRILDANVNGTVYTANANDALEALDTCHSGTTAPTDEVANGKFWLDTSTTPSVLKVYDNAGWNVVYSGRGDLTVAGTVNATALAGDGSGITGVATAAQGTLADSAVQPNDSPTFGVVTATSYAGDGSALTGIPLPPSQTTAVWEAGTDTTESVVSSAKVASAIDARVDIPSALNATGSAPIYACRAWVNIEGSGTPTIRGSGNVSSISDLGVGKYRVNFLTNMEDTNYAVLAQNGNSDTSMTSCEAGWSNAVSSTVIYTLRESNGAKTYSDQTYAHVAVFR